MGGFALDNANLHRLETRSFALFNMGNGPKERRVPKERLARKSAGGGGGVTYHINNKRRVSNERLARTSAYISL